MTERDRLPFRFINGCQHSGPVLLSVPHAGRNYPTEICAAARLPTVQLAALEDRYCDRLVADCAAAGYPVIIANVARAVVDLNRAPDDMDIDAVVPADRLRFAAPGRKARAGLGVVPTRLARGGPIWRAPLTGDVIAARIERYHAPYHRALADALGDIYARFGHALLIDVHSMPSLPVERGAPRVDIVVGDGFGATAPSWVADAIRIVADRAGLHMVVNAPYAGGHIVRTHARAAQRIFGVQIEFDRALYLQDDGNGCDAVATARINYFLSDMVGALAKEMERRDPAARWAQAAE